MLKWFKPTTQEDTTKLTEEEKFQRAASLLGVAPDFLHQRLSDQPVSKRHAARILDLRDEEVGWARQLHWAESLESWCMSKLKITKAQLDLIKQIDTEKIPVHIKGQNQLKDFLFSAVEDYEEEEGWKQKRFTEFFERIHNSTGDIKPSELTPKAILELTKDILINAYKAAYTAVRNQK